ATVGVQSGAATAGAGGVAPSSKPESVTGSATAERSAVTPPAAIVSRKSSPSRSASPPRPNAVPTRCPRCTKTADGGLPFCGYCGTRVAPAGAGMCAQCGANYLQGVDLFCARCGHRVGKRVSVEVVPAGKPAQDPAASKTQGVTAARRETQPRIALLDDEGSTAKTYILERGEAVIGRGDADIRFENDPYMSPLHARVE